MARHHRQARETRALPVPTGWQLVRSKKNFARIFRSCVELPDASDGDAQQEIHSIKARAA